MIFSSELYYNFDKKNHGQPQTKKYTDPITFQKNRGLILARPQKLTTLEIQTDVSNNISNLEKVAPPLPYLVSLCWKNYRYPLTFEKMAQTPTSHFKKITDTP